MQSINVLLSEDHPILRAGFKAIIETQQDMRLVGETCTGNEAKDLFDKVNADIFLMDLSMPQSNAKETLNWIKDRLFETNVIVLAECQDMKHLGRLFKLGVKGYFQKDEPPELLLRAIRVVSLGGTWYGQIGVGLNKSKGEYQTKYKDGNPLSKRGLETLRLIERGFTYCEISAALGISYKTVCYHVEEILRKLDVHKSLDAVMIAIEEGWIESSHRRD